MRATTNLKHTIAAAAMFGLVVIVAVRYGATAHAADIADIRWDESNTKVLQSADVSSFLESVLCGGGAPCRIDISQFAWADLEGNGKYALVSAWDYGGKVQTVSIFQQKAPGKIKKQSIDLDGYGHEEDLTNAIRDLNGDGKKELTIDCGFGQGRDMSETPLTQWPMVYRLQDGKYVEASREFPEFYDKEVLPPLDEKITALQKKVDSESEGVESGEAVMKEYHWIQPEIDEHTSPEQARAVEDSERLALLQSLHNHILRMLGRDPTVEEAKEADLWMKSLNQILVGYAKDAFEEMGGHEAGRREAEQAASRMTDDFSNAMKERKPPSPAPPPVHQGTSIGTVH
jgi:hypothetical protein